MLALLLSAVGIACVAVVILTLRDMRRDARWNAHLDRRR